jgi:TM2 domain-containing membrane protein YozV
MTETTRATCPTCTASLPAAGAPCARCTADSSGPPAGMPRHAAHQAPYSPGPFAGMPPQGAPYQPMPYQPVSHPSGPYPAPGAFPGAAPYAASPYPAAPYPAAPYPPMSYQPAMQRAPKSAGIAILLTFLWIGAGHLYLDRVGTGLVLMGAHFFLGVLLFVVFAPLGFVVWLGAVIGCVVWCNTLTGQINAGTVPARLTW